MNKVTKETPHGPVELRADNDEALAYVMLAVTNAPALLDALQCTVKFCYENGLPVLDVARAALAKAGAL